MQSPPGPETVIDGVRYLYFGGTSYLGLHGHPAVINAGCRALEHYGVHTATSRAGFGTSPLLVEVEQLAARFFGTEDAFWFASGYSANHVLAPVLAADASEVFLDDSAHYSVEEAARLVGRPIILFRDREPEDLAGKLRAHLSPGGRPLVMTDGVSPSTGRIAPVDDFISVLSGFAPATLHLDDAHGVGVLGANGRGTLDECGRWSQVNGGSGWAGVRLTAVGTLAKAMGGFGGLVAGTRAFLDQVRRASHYFDGASAPASPLAGCTVAALEICLARPDLRSTLRENVKVVRDGLRALGVPVTAEPTPNIGFSTGSSGAMRRLHLALMAEGILVPHIPSYSGLGPDGILRLAVCAGHSPEMLSRLLQALRTHLKP
ncbi:MAG: aminotransferase class I/II-fold pyridoxal phosphate-dependent enzyme [Verrucomicrobiales bacterium]